MPPLAEPSSLVSTMPVTSTTSRNTRACDQPVLAGGGVEHQQHLGDRRLLLDDPLDLAELVHQPGLVLQPAGGVDEHHVDLLLDAGADRLEGDAGRVAALGAADHVDADPLAPGAELLGGRGAERVGRAEHDLLVLGDQHPGQLADRWWSCRCR